VVEVVPFLQSIKLLVVTKGSETVVSSQLIFIEINEISVSSI